MFDLVPALHPGKPVETSARTFTTEVLESFSTSREVEGIRRDGTTVPLQMAVSAFEGDTFSHFVCTLQSSGIRKQPEEEVKEHPKGCGCEVVGGADGTSHKGSWAFALLGLASVLAVRHRRRS